MSSSHIHLAKETHHFSSAHFTFFDDGSQERLHGHNYFVKLNLTLKNETVFIPFDRIKKTTLDLCKQWDEKVLIPELSKNIIVLPASAEQFRVQAGHKLYEWPKSDILKFKIHNVTVEELAKEFSKQWVELAGTSGNWIDELSTIQFIIEETPGQGASSVWKNPKFQKFTLKVSDRFRAQHSLEGREDPHDHDFRVSVKVSGELGAVDYSGRVIDMETLRTTLIRSIDPFRNQNLNQLLTPPTSEALAQFIYKDFKQKIPVALESVSVELYEIGESEPRGEVELWSEDIQ